MSLGSLSTLKVPITVQSQKTPQGKTDTLTLFTWQAWNNIMFLPLESGGCITWCCIHYHHYKCINSLNPKRDYVFVVSWYLRVQDIFSELRWWSRLSSFQNNSRILPNNTTFLIMSLETSQGKSYHSFDVQALALPRIDGLTVWFVLIWDPKVGKWPLYITFWIITRAPCAMGIFIR